MRQRKNKKFTVHEIWQWWHRNQWLLIGVAWIAALILGFIGFARNAASTRNALTPWDLVYLTLQLIPMNSGAVQGPVSWELNAARLLIPFLTAFTALRALAALFQQQADLVRLQFIHDHIVICGLSQKGLRLTDGFRDLGDQVVVIEKNANNPLLEQCRIRGAFVLVGDARDVDVLTKAAVLRSKAVIAVSDNDGVNADIALACRKIARGRVGGAVTCIAHVVDPQLYALLREREIEMEAGSGFRFELFNAYSRGAKLLLNDLLTTTKLGQKDSSHLVIIGLGMMGESLVTNLAQYWHTNHALGDKLLGITIVDLEAARKTASLRARYPQLQTCCELFPCEIDVNTADFHIGEFLPASHSLAEVDCFCVCLDNDSLSLYTGLVLIHLTRAFGIPVFIRVGEITGLARFLHDEHENHATLKHLHAFGLLERTCTPDLLLGGTHEMLARAIHEDYVLKHKQPGEDHIREASLLPWELLPEALKESNRCQADRIGAKLKAVGCQAAPLTDWNAVSFVFEREDVDLMAQMEHESWSAQLVSEGWTYAPTKSLEKKTHPDLIPWAELSEVEKEKNRMTVRGIPRFLAQVGFQVERRQGLG